ncbi:MAG: hypothetical protein IPG66_10990 [Hydrogenophilales bacterium]|nr:hypothetical protein [Hydrogenophilales bacterium]
MKTVSIGMALLMGLSVAQAGDKPVLTYEKIGYIAQNCASSSGFAAWLENKPGITKVTQSFIHLTSLPSKSNVFFTMQGRKYSVRVSPDLSARGEVVSIALKSDSLNRTYKKYSRHERQEIQYLDNVLAEYEAKHKK